MAINGQKLKAKFQELREARRKGRERAATHRAATKEVFLKEKESQELKFAQKRAQFQAQEQFKQYKTQSARPSLAKRAGDFFGNIQLQPSGQATGFEPSPQKQGMDMGFFDSNFYGAPQRQAPKQKRRRKAKKKGKKKK